MHLIGSARRLCQIAIYKRKLSSFAFPLITVEEKHIVETHLGKQRGETFARLKSVSFHRQSVIDFR